MSKIFETIQKHHAWADGLRKYFRQHPELSGRETNTQAKLIEELTALELSCKKIAGTGVVAELAGAQPGKVIAVRADMDALPLEDACGKGYQSQNPGACHACGHDGHMAVLLGTIRSLIDLKNDIAGNFRFIFQPSEEEFPSGAAAAIAGGCLKGVDAVIGAHIWQPLKLGVIGISYGDLMAAPDKFKITVNGKGGHGSMPHQTTDPTLIAAEIILALHTIVSRSLDPLDLAAISIGSLHAGNAFNIIPGTAVIEGTVRSFKESVREKIFKRIDEIANGLCLANQASYELETLYGHPAVVNDAAYAKQIELAARQCRSEIKTEIIPPVMCAEDFSYYLKEVPGAFFFIGTGTEKARYPHHHPKFDIDSRSILYGMEVMTRAAVQFGKI